MKFERFIYPLSVLLLISSLVSAASTSPAVTTTFSNLLGNNGEKSNVVFSYATGKPILKNTGYVAIGTFKLSHAEISQLSTAASLDAAFYQFGEGSDFNAIEDGAFQCDASGNPDQVFDGLDAFSGSNIYIVIGNGDSLITSSEYLVWDSGVAFDNTGPLGGAWEVFLSVGKGTLLIGLENQHISDFSMIGGDSDTPAFTTVKIDGSLDDHGDTINYSTVVLDNSNTSALVDDGNDIDYFRIDLGSDGNLFLTLTADFNPRITLSDSSGNVIGAIQDSGDALNGGVAPDYIINKDLAAGTYFVSVAGYGNTDIGGYSLESLFTPYANDDDTDDDSGPPSDNDDQDDGGDDQSNDNDSVISVAAPAKGSFTGLLYREENNEEAGKITVTITKRIGGLSYFTGRIAGTNKYSTSSFKGKFDFGGKYSGQVYNSNGLLSIADMAFIQDTTGRLSLGGVLLSPDGTRETFSLVSKYYNDTWRKPTEFRNPSRYTYLAASPTTDSLAVPAGDAIGYGSISSKGKVVIKGWSNAGYKYTYKGFLQNGNQVGLPGNADFQAGTYGTIPFYARTYGESSKKSTSRNEWMVGIIRYDMSGAVESVDGRIRYVKPASNSRYYPAGFDQNIEMKGSKYSRTGFAAIPVNGFELFANNALGSFEGSLLDDSEFTPYVFTWNSKGYMKVPSNFTVYKKGRMRNKHGFFTSTLIDYVTGKRASIRGVVLQNRGVVSGHALNSSGVSVRHSISPSGIQVESNSP